MHITVTRSLYLRRSAAAALQSSARDPRERPPPPRAPQNRHHSPSTLHAKISFSSDARHTALSWPGRGEGARALRHPSAGSPLGGAEAVRVGADPPPRVGAHLLEAELRLRESDQPRSSRDPSATPISATSRPHLGRRSAFHPSSPAARDASEYTTATSPGLRGAIS